MKNKTEIIDGLEEALCQTETQIFAVYQILKKLAGINFREKF